MALKTIPWDVVKHLDSEEAQLAYLEAAFEDGDPSLIAAAFGDVARARGASEVAKSAGVSREALYKSFQPEGNPTLSTTTSVARALGYRLSIERIDPKAA